MSNNTISARLPLASQINKVAADGEAVLNLSMSMIVQAIKKNYPFIPDGSIDSIVNTELSNILTDAKGKQIFLFRAILNIAPNNEYQIPIIVDGGSITVFQAVYSKTKKAYLPLVEEVFNGLIQNNQNLIQEAMDMASREMRSRYSIPYEQSGFNKFSSLADNYDGLDRLVSAYLDVQNYPVTEDSKDGITKLAKSLSHVLTKLSFNVHSDWVEPGLAMLLNDIRPESFDKSASVDDIRLTRGSVVNAMNTVVARTLTKKSSVYTADMIQNDPQIAASLDVVMPEVLAVSNCSPLLKHSGIYILQEEQHSPDEYILQKDLLVKKAELLNTSDYNSLQPTELGGYVFAAKSNGEYDTKVAIYKNASGDRVIMDTGSSIGKLASNLLVDSKTTTTIDTTALKALGYVPASEFINKLASSNTGTTIAIAFPRNNGTGYGVHTLMCKEANFIKTASGFMIDKPNTTVLFVDKDTIPNGTPKKAHSGELYFPKEAYVKITDWSDDISSGFAKRINDISVIDESQYTKYAMDITNPYNSVLLENDKIVATGDIVDVLKYASDHLKIAASGIGSMLGGDSILRNGGAKDFYNSRQYLIPFEQEYPNLYNFLREKGTLNNLERSIRLGYKYEPKINSEDMSNINLFGLFLTTDQLSSTLTATSRDVLRIFDLVVKLRLSLYLQKDALINQLGIGDDHFRDLQGHLELITKNLAAVYPKLLKPLT